MRTLASAMFLAAAIGGPQEKEKEKATATDLSWLEGRWEGPSGDGTVEEHWMRPVGGVMLGMGRMTKGDRTIFTEFLKIVETKEGVEYRALIDGQPEVAFRLTKRSDGEVLFENPDHDFPQKIGYRKEKDGVLAWIEGTQDGKPPAKMEFRLKAKK